MSKDLGQAGTVAKRILRERQAQKDEGTKNIRIRGNLYKRLKIVSAYRDIPIRELADKALQKALDNGDI